MCPSSGCLILFLYLYTTFPLSPFSVSTEDILGQGKWESKGLISCSVPTKGTRNIYVYFLFIFIHFIKNIKIGIQMSIAGHFLVAGIKI